MSFDHVGLLRDIETAMDNEPFGEVSIRWWTSGDRRFVEVKRTESWRPTMSNRAGRRAAEVQQVVDLIRERGSDAVTLDMVRRALGFKKTTAYYRLTEARELLKREAKR
jgi:hypothetical protein